jgi:hypothetical protein
MVFEKGLPEAKSGAVFEGSCWHVSGLVLSLPKSRFLVYVLFQQASDTT